MRAVERGQWYTVKRTENEAGRGGEFTFSVGDRSGPQWEGDIWAKTWRRSGRESGDKQEEEQAQETRDDVHRV